ncbi:PKD domain-containing protein [Pigmentiphaga kullae]|uniref:PKD domain-containing protein n=1 Tax=Pigmentiphaga kullae TaxID=151784 RepID=A0A4Q7N7R4_9BURK|nr:PKD domain-containing protein [Pigmentiphaga kullae]RZS78102.1 hypothetical protein EV675_4743 [Pigmentiphaga kullae]
MQGSLSGSARHLLAALTGALVLTLAACGGDGAKPQEPPAASTKAVIEAQAARSTASVGKSVDFSVSAVTDGTKIDQYRWTFSDGQRATGQRVSASFGKAGPVTATVQAISGGQSVAEGSAAVVVVDAGNSPYAEFGIPSKIGNIAGNAKPGLVDAMRLGQYVGGLNTLDELQVARADINLDGTVDEADVALAMQAAAAGQELPSALLSTQAYPGAVVAMVSPALLNPEAQVAIKVDGVASPQVFRMLPGYASFLVPAGLARNAKAQVVVSVNGAASETLALDLLAPLQPAVPAAQDVRAFFDRIDRLMQAQHDAIVAEPSGLSAQDAEQLRKVAAAGRSAFGNARLELERVLAGPNGDTLAKVFQKALLANGMREFQAESQEVLGKVSANAAAGPMAAAVSPDQICDFVLPELCRLKKTADMLGEASSIASAACSAVTATIFIAGAVIPADGPAIEIGAVAAFVKFCVPISATLSVASTLGEIVKPIDPKLYLTVSPLSLKPGESALVKPEVAFIGLQHLCGMGASQGAGYLVKQIIGKRVVAGILRSNTAARTLADFFAKYAEDLYVKLLDGLADAAGNALDAAGVMGAIESFVTNRCAVVPAGRATMPANRVLMPLSADKGSYSFNSDGTANYNCPSASPTSVGTATLEASWPMCDGLGKATEIVGCSTSDVLITMGDNGSALDDIFEVIVAGQTVLTSSAPVRSVSASVPIPGGQTEVLMRGLAAPDGVGTYFITFSSNARVVGGDSLSGSDLTPGVTKRFIIEVQ